MWCKCDIHLKNITHTVIAEYYFLADWKIRWSFTVNMIYWLVFLMVLFIKCGINSGFRVQGGIFWWLVLADHHQSKTQRCPVEYKTEDTANPEILRAGTREWLSFLLYKYLTVIITYQNRCHLKDNYRIL